MEDVEDFGFEVDEEGLEEGFGAVCAEEVPELVRELEVPEAGATGVGAAVVRTGLGNRDTGFLGG